MTEIDLEKHEAGHEFLIAIDSDGCAFDTMELKHKECFIPEIIRHWELQAVSKYARQAAEFVNLYSFWRGVNRFPALTMVFDLLNRWPEVQRRFATIPRTPNLNQWILEEKKLGNPALEVYCAEHQDQADMQRALAWSIAVNDSIAKLVKGVPPFPGVRQTLADAARSADILVCSATPQAALYREWEEHGIAEYPFAICGQEQGTKSQHIAKASHGRYEPYNILMIGDAIGDLKAAQANNAHFFPICPGNEEQSWELFYNEVLEMFLVGSYCGAYENEAIDRFTKCLPELPPWEQVTA